METIKILYRRDDEIVAATMELLYRRQCAALCAKICLHVARLMESARFYCNRKLFCARRLRLSYRTSHVLIYPVRKREREREMIFAKTLPAYVWQNFHQFFIAHSSNCILCQDAASNCSFTKIVVINICKIVNLCRNILYKFNKFILRIICIIYIQKYNQNFLICFLFY